MNLNQLKFEISELGKIPASEKMYPITSEWVPLPDVLAIIGRFENHWKQIRKTGDDQARIVKEILGEA